MATQSENIITKISSNVFYKEFTFDKNEFFPHDGSKELADNILWLENLLFIIQVKERNINEVKTELDENKWFEKKVLRVAVKQVKNSIAFFKNYDNINIKNVRSHEIDISRANLTNVKKLIIYMPNSSLISNEYKTMKFYESNQVGNIHILNIEDYLWICKYLITPTEVDEYLSFRERIYLKHKEKIKNYPEQYILGHFLKTDNEEIINEEYIDSLRKIVDDFNEFDISSIINNFLENIYDRDQKESTDYYSIIKELALLKRYELSEFKKRFVQVKNDVNSFVIQLPHSPHLPLRFTSVRTKCGFVFIALPHDKIEYWENALINFTEIYKYKNKLSKCIGISLYKIGEYFEINWAYLNNDWEYNKELEEYMKVDNELYGESEIKLLKRYNFND